MNLRNLKYTKSGAINCDYEHPSFGWIPYTASPNDSEALGRDIYAAALSGTFGPVAPVDPDPLPTLSDYVTALTNHLDTTAQTKSYDNRITCAVRAGYPGPFQAEGIAFATWMDAQNAKGYQILADVQGEVIPQPTIAEFMAMLDPMIWPS